MNKQTTNSPLGLNERYNYKQIVSHLSLQDQASLARTCTFFHRQLQPDLNTYREQLLEIFPESILRAPLFKKYPIPYWSLLRLLPKIRLAIQGFFNSSDDGIWQLAALCGLDECVNEYLGDRIQTTRNGGGFGVMHYYALGGHTALFQEYIATHSPTFTHRDDPGKIFIKLAVNGNHIELVKLLITQYGYNPLKQERHPDMTLLHFAAMGGALECTKLLIEKGVPLNIGDCPAMTAAQSGHFALFDYFLEQNIKPLVTQKSQYEYIIQCIHHHQLARALRTIVRHNISPTLIQYNDETLLSSASEAGYLEAIRFFLEQGWYNQNHRFESGANIIHQAAMYGKINFVIDAIETLGFDPQEKSNHGNTLLHFLAMNGNWRKFCMIRERYFHKQPPTKNHLGSNIAHLAARNGNLPFLKDLIDAQGTACLHELNRDGETILEQACRSGNPELVLWLVEIQGFQSKTLREILVREDPHNLLNYEEITNLWDNNTPQGRHN